MTEARKCQVIQSKRCDDFRGVFYNLWAIDQILSHNISLTGVLRR